MMRDLAKKMNFCGDIGDCAGGILGILAGVIALLTASTNATGDGSLNFSNLIQGIFLLLIGIWTRNAAIAFKRVVNTTGRDVEI